MTPEQECQKLRALCAAVYQAAGACDMPERFLDALSDGATGDVEQRQKTDSLLPCDAPKECQLDALRAAAEWMDDHGEVVFSGGGWNSVNAMNAAREKLRTALGT